MDWIEVPAAEIAHAWRCPPQEPPPPVCPPWACGCIMDASSYDICVLTSG